MSANPPTTRSGRPRELYLDVFRGLMALVMVQGHVCDALLSPELRAQSLYQFQTIFHGSTAPGFLFASGFVAGLPRAPLALRASLRRARRLLFVLGVGYALHLPYFSFWKTVAAPPAERLALFACDALQAIAVTQLVVLGLQWLFSARWTTAAGALALTILAVGPWIWASGLARRLPPALGAYLDATGGSHFPLFPFAAFVLCGTVAGVTLGRKESATRHKRELVWGSGLLVLGGLLSLPLARHVDFWGVSPAYALMRLGGLLLLLRLVEALTRHDLPGTRPLALLGHETLLVFVLHLHLLFGGVLGPHAFLTPYIGHLGWVATAGVLVLMLPILWLAALAWHRLKALWPHAAQQLLAFLTVVFLWEFFMRPW